MTCTSSFIECVFRGLNLYYIIASVEIFLIFCLRLELNGCSLQEYPSLPCTPWSKRISWLLKLVVMVPSSSFSYFALNNKIKWIIMNLSPKAFSQSFDIQNKIFKVQNAQKNTSRGGILQFKSKQRNVKLFHKYQNCSLYMIWCFHMIIKHYAV